MNRSLACQILGIPEDHDLRQLKKVYRAAVKLSHPDAVVQEGNAHPYPVHEINAAYSFLLEQIRTGSAEREGTAGRKQASADGRAQASADRSQNIGRTSAGRTSAGQTSAGWTSAGQTSPRKPAMHWNASLNQNAYAKREIYQYVEDAEGERIGTMTVAVGRYLWIPDEEFPLFWMSVVRLGKRLVQAADARLGLDRSTNQKLLADLVYLLVGQFIDSEDVLRETAKADAEGIYHVDAMLELTDALPAPKDGEWLIPAAVKDHRLYVKDAQGNLRGYVSFVDDRLYYGLIPLFERRAVQVKMTVVREVAAGTQKKRQPKQNIGVNRRGSLRSVNLELQVRRLPEERIYVMENIDVKIERLLYPKRT